METQISKEELTARIISIISGALSIDSAKITPCSGFINDLNADSLDMLDIRFSIEQEFGFKIDGFETIKKTGDDQTSLEFKEKFTVATLIDFVEEKIKPNTHADTGILNLQESNLL